MNRTLVVLALVAGLATCAKGFSPEALDEYPVVADDDPESRLFLVTSNTTTVTVGYASFILGVTSIIVLGALICLAYFYVTGDDLNKYDYSGSGSGYSGTYARKASFDPYAIDWEKFSIIDWIAIGEEAWRKFDPADLECQKRLICEIHQNTSRFGVPAARLVDLFSYLQYAEVLSLPDEIKALIEEYNDAADRGRSIQKDCGDVYTTCDFSVKQIMEKYSHNEI
ncbi:uncharacterized protein LOC126983955 isoform X4 [Eriocheir sinensis]|uniref:uncharacterized protein LOC126983955 isoform X4 n=1 Tax=Eriocheir sinensis TaxID=95602 RepID=UPI0021C9A4C8|nr:uncharacterized protein LOC126983955 isoform X4 [Eriocheir sinensis]XP_050693182.1 uncharacterized protein LOC126983955 isoform X4 [Eriocheir sinensis]